MSSVHEEHSRLLTWAVISHSSSTALLFMELILMNAGDNCQLTCKAQHEKFNNSFCVSKREQERALGLEQVQPTLISPLPLLAWTLIYSPPHVLSDE